MKNKLLLLIFIIAVSCSTKLIESLEPKHSYKVKPNIKQMYCPVDSNFALNNDNKESQRLFYQFLNKVTKYYKLEFVDKSVLWSLYQMNLRPDIASPYSSAQFIIKINNKDYYFNSIKKKKDSLPFIHGLDFILKNFQSKYGLNELISLYQENFTKPSIVNENFAKFLRDNRKDLETNNYYKKAYLRGEEVLKEGEIIPKINYKKLYNHYQKTKLSLGNYKVIDKLYSSKEKGVSCNQKIDFQKKTPNILPKAISSYQYGLSENVNSFIASTSLAKIRPENTGDIYFNGTSSFARTSICKFDKNWILISNSRDTTQHMIHLVEYGILKDKNIEQYKELIDYPRHIFLKNPNRIIFESTRSHRDQVDALNKLNIPIYSAKEIAHINLLITQKKRPRYILDTRSKEQISCK